jgi:DNA polymerase/3'-5' exonuclease PolX
MKMMKKQSTLFPQDAVKIIDELDLKEAERIVSLVKATVESQCEKIEVAGSLRRQKSKVHDIDFVVIAKSDVDWHKICEKLKVIENQA